MFVVLFLIPMTKLRFPPDMSISGVPSCGTQHKILTEAEEKNQIERSLPPDDITVDEIGHDRFPYNIVPSTASINCQNSVRLFKIIYKIVNRLLVSFKSSMGPTCVYFVTGSGFFVFRLLCRFYCSMCLVRFIYKVLFTNGKVDRQ